MTEVLRAPWSEEQVAALKQLQACGRFHPYTCGNESRHRDLMPTTNGWICLDCDYKQDWCYGGEIQLMALLAAKGTES